MGWRGALRSMAAASRAAARENQRRAKFYAKEQMISEASDAVEEWQERIDKLSSIRVIIESPMEWQVSAAQPEPEKPTQGTSHKDRAQAALNDFTPSFWDFFQGGSAKKRQKLESNLAAAPCIDREEFDATMQAYAKSLADWKEETELAKRVLALESGAFKEVIQEALGAFKEALFGKSIEFLFGDNFVHVLPIIFSTDIVPKFRRKQLASGRLSETDMPAAQFYKLYQDYVSGTALGVADSIFKLLPTDEVYITCKAEMLNTTTGHQEIMPILSVQFVRKTMENLNLRSIDASDALGNFNHAVSFKRSSGYTAITPLTKNT